VFHPINTADKTAMTSMGAIVEHVDDRQLFSGNTPSIKAQSGRRILYSASTMAR
jgi:hypothetical protein